jgi:ligand-binding sensor domain-containing protein/signal transduction histidine kinase
MALSRFLVLLAALPAPAAPPARADATAPASAAPASAAPPSALPAGAVPVEFEHVSLEEGVSHNLIYAIHQDRTGFLWFGTMYGLVRYDGRDYRAYRHDPLDPASLSYDDIVCLAEDEAGFLWVGTYGGGVNRFDPATGRVSRFTGLSSGIIWSLAADPSGDVWAGTQAGLDRVDPRSGAVEPVPLDDAGAVRALLVDRSGALWIGTEAGGLLRRGLDGAMTRWPQDPDDPETQPVAGVGAIAEDAEGRIWIGSRGAGLLRAVDGRIEKVAGIPGRPLTSLAVSALLAAPDGRLWIGTSRGLDVYGPADGVLEHFRHDPADDSSLRGHSVVALCRDRSGVLWVGTYLAGLDRVPPPGARFPRFGADFDGPRGRAHRSVRAFAEDADGTLWIGTDGGLVAREGVAGPFRTYLFDGEDPKTLGGPAVTALLVDPVDGTLWAGTSGGLSRYDHANDAFRTDRPGEDADAPGGVTALLRDRGGALWVGTGGGLLRRDPQTGRYDRFRSAPEDPRSLSDDTVLSLYEDRMGRLWVGTYAGLNRRDPGGEGFRHFRQDPGDPASLGNNYVYAFHETVDGTLWLATGGGLDRYDEGTGTFTHFDRRAGLPNDVLSDLLEADDGALWIATHKGLVRFDPADGSCQAYDTGDGLQSNLFHARAALRTADGTMLFGGIGGYNAFRPDAVGRRAAAAAPPVVVTRFRARGGPPRDVVGAEPVRLGPADDFFAFDFAALDYVRPDRIRYRYRLEGLQEEWIDAGTTGSASFAGVPPGRYTFRVTAASRDGAWADPGAAVPVLIAPPFWRTAWFAALVLAAGAAAVWGAHRLRVRARVAQSLAIERAREQERDLMRRRAADDFHDELGHRLTKIGLYSEVVRRHLAGVTPEVGAWLARIVNESRHLSDDARDFLWSLGPEGDTLHDLMTYLSDFGVELFDRTDVEFSVEGVTEATRGVALSMESRRHIGSIFKEAMNNALRHSGGRHVTLAARLAEDDFEVELRDDGRGWQRTSVRAGNGLKNMELRARKIDGTIRIASSPGAGSTITLKRRGAVHAADRAGDDPGSHRRGRR